MDFPITNRQLSTRLTQEELDLFNEVVTKLFPDQDWSDPTLTLRTLFVRILEAAEMKLKKLNESLPADVQKIKELTKLFADKETEYSEQKARNSDLVAEISDLKTRISELETRNQELETLNLELGTERTEVVEKAEKLQKYAPVPNERRIIIEPLSAALLDLYAEKVRLRTKTDASSGEILINLFTRYITKRETELPGFPFLVTKQEIIELAKSLNNE